MARGGGTVRVSGMATVMHPAEEHSFPPDDLGCVGQNTRERWTTALPTLASAESAAAAAHVSYAGV